MTPRPDVVWLTRTSLRGNPAKDHSRQPHALPGGRRPDRPNYRTGQLQRPPLQNLSCQPIDLRSVLRPALFIPESMSALDMLERFKQKRTHVAFVIDEHGGSKAWSRPAISWRPLSATFPCRTRPKKPTSSSAKTAPGCGREGAGRRAQGPAANGRAALRK